MPKLAERVIEHAKFLYAQRVSGFQVETSPFLGSDEATAWFSDQMRKCRAYLEFGAGGSTYLAAAENKQFVTIDSDRYFLRAVKSAIVESGNYRPNRQSFIHREIGPITKWGTPIRSSSPDPKRTNLFRQYSDPPLSAFGGNLPDLILIDGRFRVASALKTIKALAQQTGWMIVVDDYFDRFHYRNLEKFAHLSKRVGRLGVFTGILQDVHGLLDAHLKAAELDCR
jgi:hypothetical protein